MRFKSVPGQVTSELDAKEKCEPLDTFFFQNIKVVEKILKCLKVDI